MDIRKVKKLIELVEESGIDELEIRDGEESVRITRHRQAPATDVQHVLAPVSAAPATEPASSAATTELARQHYVHQVIYPTLDIIYCHSTLLVSAYDVV